MKYPRKGKIGAWVRLRVRVRRGPQKALIVRRFGQGGVELDQPLDGYRCWNVCELEYVNERTS